MRVLHVSSRMKEEVERARENGKLIGFVPTMGALHKGHLSLVDQCAALCDVVVISIFVNPTQFNDPTDFQTYPRTLDQDIKLLETASCHMVFVPSVEEMYPKGGSFGDVNLGRLDNILEGAHRPGHFHGVAQVVERLFRIVAPDMACFGMKDYQQLIVIQQMVKQLDLPVRIVPCPTVRDLNGLAMSSRNLRLSDAGRQKASAIHRVMTDLSKKLAIEGLQPASCIPLGIKMLEDVGFSIEYLSLCEPETLLPIEDPLNGRSGVLLFAGWLEEVRLIDNLLINV